MLRLSGHAIAQSGLFEIAASLGADVPFFLEGGRAFGTSRGDEATAAILARTPGPIFTAGDNAYESGTLGQYESCYGPSWGQFKAQTRPAPGNHEYDLSPNAAPYFAYFGAKAGAANATITRVCFGAAMKQ